MITVVFSHYTNRCVAYITCSEQKALENNEVWSNFRIVGPQYRIHPSGT